MLFITGSIFISFAYIFLIKIMPAIIILLLTILSIVSIAFLCIQGIVIDDKRLSISMAVVLLIYIFLILCYKNKVKMGVLLAKTAAKFMTDKPIVFLSPFPKIIVGYLFSIFWVYSISHIQ